MALATGDPRELGLTDHIESTGYEPTLGKERRQEAAIAKRRPRSRRNNCRRQNRHSLFNNSTLSIGPRYTPSWEPVCNGGPEAANGRGTAVAQSGPQELCQVHHAQDVLTASR
jgi:hypothetical protein